MCWWYIFWFLHQTTTRVESENEGHGCISFDSYIKPQPSVRGLVTCESCISFDSYIKPQLLIWTHFHNLVVYLLIPTSNHNWRMRIMSALVLYIFWFLHQTTTGYIRGSGAGSCISFDSYIKPQPIVAITDEKKVVYLLIPTSNHNLAATCPWLATVVYLLIPTSNHNRKQRNVISGELYIFWFLHQTTTSIRRTFLHNLLYIFWFLHQTTTGSAVPDALSRCISFDSYIKPQHTDANSYIASRCISFDSYIKPQPITFK